MFSMHANNGPFVLNHSVVVTLASSIGDGGKVRIFLEILNGIADELSKQFRHEIIMLAFHAHGTITITIEENSQLIAELRIGRSQR